MLYGFSIAGFRNFGSQPQWVGPLSRINIFIGTNNSGKSNVLRYIKKVVAPALKPGRSASISTVGVDTPRSGERPTKFDLRVPFVPQDHFGSSVSWEQVWSDALRSCQVFDGQDHLKIPVTLSSVASGMLFAGEIPDLDSKYQNQIHRAWSSLLNRNGGNFSHWYSELMNSFIKRSIQKSDPHFIPSFRQIPTRLAEFEGEFSLHSGDDHLIDDLAALASPPYNEQEKKAKFEKLRKFIGEIISDPDVLIEIPSNRMTINVRSEGKFLPIEALGSGVHEVFLLAAELILRDDQIILLEEPEVHLHPHLQRRLMRFINEETEAQYFITTHSSSIIDTPGATVFGVRNEEFGKIRPLLTSQDKYLACKELGHKASDLLQANCIVWVEGPSDRIYVLDWIRRVDSSLIDGVHFSVMFYGGKLLSRISAEDSIEMNDFVKILPLCRNACLIADSDLGSANSSVRSSKLRVQKELSAISGFFWLTAGREIENYYSSQQRLSAVQAVHKSAVRLVGGSNRYAKPLNYEDAQSNVHDSKFDKMGIAKYIVENDCAPSDDCLVTVRELVEYIRQANL